MTDQDAETGAHPLPRDSDPSLVDDEREWYHKAELWYFLLPVLLVLDILLSIRVVQGLAGTPTVVAWGILLVFTILVVPFWSWYLEPTPADAGHAHDEVGEPPHADSTKPHEPHSPEN